jgi:hypothetical protein
MSIFPAERTERCTKAVTTRVCTSVEPVVDYGRFDGVFAEHR